MLTEKLVGWYRRVSNILCWVWLIFGVVSGFTTGLNFGHNIITAILGTVLGGGAAFIIELLLVPPVLVLFEINEKLGNK